jgi:thiamine biosynthesis lipoprotein
MSGRESIETFDCFGGSCSILVSGDDGGRTAAAAAHTARLALLAWHARFSRFLPESELTLLNSDPREVVPVSEVMALLAEAIRDAGNASGGLVDGTLVAELCRSGYAGELPPPLPLAEGLVLAPPRRPARPGPGAGFTQIEVDLGRGLVRRPPGLLLDSGGLGKGLFADLLARRLSAHGCFAVACAGDLALGGRAGLARPVHVESPFDGSVLHTFRLARGGVATSGIGRRSWRDAEGRPAHHLLDPSTGRPAFTGIVQATAIAASALEAEVRAKAALLTGPRGAARWLPDGGALVLDDGSHIVFDPPPAVALSDLSAFAHAA